MHNFELIVCFGGITVYVQMIFPCKHPPPILACEFQVPVGTHSDSTMYITAYTT